MLSTLKAYRHYDPAAKNYFEIIFLYPGVKAVFLHKISNYLFKLNFPFIPRLISEFSRWLTGIEIHPGATIGHRLIIDHGMGVVIGETAVIGDDVIIYHGVTLGGTNLNPVKRHPTISSKVVIGAGAKILGNIIIGEGSRVGCNSVVVNNIPPNSTVVGIPGKIIDRGIKAGEELAHQNISD